MAQNGGGDPGHAAVETYCFQPEVFVEPHFTVEGFIKECKLRVPMAELKVDLGQCQPEHRPASSSHGSAGPARDR